MLVTRLYAEAAKTSVKAAAVAFPTRLANARSAACCVVNGHPLVPVRLVQLPPAPCQVTHEPRRYTKADGRTTLPDSPILW